MSVRNIVKEIIDEESAAAKAAKKAGLVHLGFGRYGPKKGGSATHVSKDGKLKSVGDDSGGEPADKPFGGDTGTDADYEPSQQAQAHTAAADAELDRIDKEKQSKDEPEQSAYDKMGPEARELKLTMDSTEEGYKQQYIPILKNLSRKMKKGTYDKEKAVKLFMYYVDNGARRYAKDYGGGGATGPSVGGFDKKAREEAARAYVEDFEDVFQTGISQVPIIPIDSENLFIASRPKRLATMPVEVLSLTIITTESEEKYAEKICL